MAAPSKPAHLAPVPWGGRETLVIGLDIGTTQTASSIVHLYPGQVPKYRSVGKWSDAPNSSKVPSLVVYTPEGRPVAYGAEALHDQFADNLDDEKLFMAKHFKLHLHPKSIGGGGAGVEGARNVAFTLPPLPPNVPVRKCYADLIKYTFDNTRQFFIENTPDGNIVWDKLGAQVEIVLAFPNGWGLPEQAVMTGAVEDAGLIGPGRQTRLHLVTEAEASVHFGLLHSEGNIEGWTAPESSFVVVDAGGSTVDTCVYTVQSLYPKLKLREAKLSESIQAGGIYVSQEMEKVIKRKLADSTYNTPEFITTMMSTFDSKAKLLFSNATETQILKFGFDRDNDRSVGISRGRLTLSGAEVEEAFIPTVDHMIQSIRRQISDVPVTHILCVGGCGESPYIQRRLRETFETAAKPIRVLTVDEPSRKAVAQGSLVYYVKDSVVARATRFEFGLSTNRPYSPEIAQGRQIISFSSGKSFLSGGWTPIVKKGEVIQFNVPHKESFWVHKRPNDSLVFSTKILSFDGEDPMKAHNGFSRDPTGELYPEFRECCTITGDLTDLAIATKISRTPEGEKYRELDFKIGLFFGDTTLRACLLWDNNGVEIQGAASVIPSTFI